MSALSGYESESSGRVQIGLQIGPVLRPTDKHLLPVRVIAESRRSAEIRLEMVGSQYEHSSTRAPSSFSQAREWFGYGRTGAHRPCRPEVRFRGDLGFLGKSAFAAV